MVKYEYLSKENNSIVILNKNEISPLVLRWFWYVPIYECIRRLQTFLHSGPIFEKKN